LTLAAERPTLSRPIMSTPLSPPAHRRPLVALASAAALVCVAAFGLAATSRGRTAPARLAVLPFDNGGDTTDAYFADGVTDELRTTLAAVKGVEVIATASAAHYRHTSDTPDAIGRELHVRYILRGTVTRANGRIQINPELFDAAGTGETWSAPFSAPLPDMFLVEHAIAGHVAGALGLNATPQAASLSHNELAAYDLFLRGQYTRAIATDPSFAPAWARLSSAQTWQWEHQGPDSAVAHTAHDDATRALALAPTLGAAHGAMAQYDATIAHDNAAAVREYEMALNDAPNDADLLVASAMTDREIGRWNVALDRLAQAERIDPFGSAAPRARGTTLLRLRRYPEARAELDQALKLAPGSADAIVDRALVEICAGDRAAARAAMRAGARDVDSAALYAYAAGVFGAIGVLDTTTWRFVSALPPKAFGGNRAAWALGVAQAYALLGDKDKTRAYADTARAVLEPAVRGAPDAPALRAELGLAFAYMGRKADAMREGERAVTLAPPPENTWLGPAYQQDLARIYLLVGEHDKAADLAQSLLRSPALLSTGWIAIDPAFAAVRRKN
jgi:TolB-like protein/tetratricopeptide (TPR) repeat protein